MLSKILATIMFVGILILLVGYSVQVALSPTPAPEPPLTLQLLRTTMDRVSDQPAIPVLQSLAHQAHQPKRADTGQKLSGAIQFTVIPPLEQDLVLVNLLEKSGDIDQ